jgi:hypothetical protein
VPVGNSLCLLNQQFDEGNIRLFHHVLTSSFFCFNYQFYEQTGKVAMGSPLSPIISTFFMEDFEEVALSRATYNPTCWFCYVDDTFVIWPHGLEELNNFLNHFRNIQLTMERVEWPPSFLDIDIYRRSDGSLGHNAYWNPPTPTCV